MTALEFQALGVVFDANGSKLVVRGPQGADDLFRSLKFELAVRKRLVGDGPTFPAPKHIRRVWHCDHCDDPIGHGPGGSCPLCPDRCSMQSGGTCRLCALARQTALADRVKREQGERGELFAPTAQSGAAR